MTELARRSCTPCRGGVPPLAPEPARRLLAGAPGRELREDARKIRCSYRFADFEEALAFVGHVGALAEAEGHHPDVWFGWGYATVSLQTEKIKGLHENDFILAARIDRLAPRRARTARFSKTRRPPTV